MKLQMLFSAAFHDYPLNGLAIYNNEEVYFTPKSERLLKEEEYTAEIKTIINQLKYENEAYRYVTLKDYEIDYDGEADEIFVQRKLFYDLYRLPKDLHEKFKNQHIQFSEAVGYHCWHDPKFYKPYVEKDNSDYYKNNKPFNINHLDKYEHLGTFRYDEFEYFSRPDKFC